MSAHTFCTICQWELNVFCQTECNDTQNRNRNFSGVVKSPVVGYNAENQRIRYLGLGNPAIGANGGNTASNTHRVLKIIKEAQTSTSNFGDGGWKIALSVSVSRNQINVLHNLFAHTHHHSTYAQNVEDCQRFDDLWPSLS